MASIIIFGDIDISALYISVDGGKELTVSGKYPRKITVSAGEHKIFATTVTKMERIAGGISSGDFLDAAATALSNSTNTTLEGVLDFDSDDVLLIEVEQKGMKTLVHNKLVSASEANQYIEMANVLDFGDKEPGQKNKWVALLLCMFFGVFGVHRFYEKKIGTGILYLLTLGVFGIGVIIDFFAILFRKQ